MINSNKFAIISKSNKSAEGLEHKSLKAEIKKLREEGYTIINKIAY